MSLFRDLSDKSTIPLQRYFQLLREKREGLHNLSDKESVLHLRCLLAVTSLEDPARHHQKLLDDVLLKCKKTVLPNDKRQHILQGAKQTLRTEEVAATSVNKANDLLASVKDHNPKLAALLHTGQAVLSWAEKEVAAQQQLWDAHPMTDTTTAQPRPTDNPLFRSAAAKRLNNAASDRAEEPPTRKRPHEDVDCDARPTRRGWGELNFSRAGASSLSDPNQTRPTPKDAGHTAWKKSTWTAASQAGGPLRDVSNNHAAGGLDDSHTSEEDDAPGARGGFVTASTVLTSELRKKGHSFAGYANNAGGHQVGPAPRTGLARPRGAPAKGGGGGSVRSGFVPPFMQKAMDGPGEGKESPYSEKVLNLLGLGPDDEVPEEIAKLDPKMVETVCNEIVDSSGSVKWDDIAGQDAAKTLVQELVVWPILNPHLFKGARSPPRGLLLFGPPGTGKTLIGKAIASNMDATFFSISASSLTSKWIGEGEKMVRALFAVAGCLQPSVIFIDEIDSILSARKSDGEHEASRRLKTEMLIQMEGCDPNSSSRRLLIIGATNRPEELDEAARRRLPKQLYIPLPCSAARRHMILRQLGPGGSVTASLSEADLSKIVAKTDGYSGSDMRNLIQEACQGPVREAVKQHGSALSNLSEDDLRPVNIKDFQLAAKVQKASVAPIEVERYEQYNKVHGARYIDSGEGASDAAEEEDDW